jgi:hypothetical protein
MCGHQGQAAIIVNRAEPEPVAQVQTVVDCEIVERIVLAELCWFSLNSIIARFELATKG